MAQLVRQFACQEFSWFSRDTGEQIQRTAEDSWRRSLRRDEGGMRMEQTTIAINTHEVVMQPSSL